MERRFELENLSRSLMMLSPGVSGLTREEALRLVGELVDAQERIDQLITGLRRLLEDAEGPGG
jgi:hypothetical protein